MDFTGEDSVKLPSSTPFLFDVHGDFGISPQFFLAFRYFEIVNKRIQRLRRRGDGTRPRNNEEQRAQGDQLDTDTPRPAQVGGCRGSAVREVEKPETNCNFNRMGQIRR